MTMLFLPGNFTAIDSDLVAPVNPFGYLSKMNTGPIVGGGGEEGEKLPPNN